MVKENSEPVRQCAVTRETFEMTQLVRFVLNPDGMVVPDIKKQLPGRGVWVLAQIDKVELAIKRHVFSKAFRQSVKVPENLADEVNRLLRMSVIQRLALSNKAGLVTIGFEKVSSVLNKKNIIALIHATTASAESCKKLDNKFYSVQNKKNKNIKLVNCFDSDELSSALGRTNVMHIALETGGASLSFLENASQLERYNLG